MKSRHLFSKSLWLLTVLLVALTTGAITAFQLSAQADNCLSLDFRQGFGMQGCSPNLNYDYEPVEADWGNAALFLGVLALVDLSILISLWNIRLHFEGALLPKANDTHELTDKERQQKVARVEKRHRKVAVRLLAVASIGVILAVGAWIASSVVTYNNNDFILNGVTGYALTVGIPLFLDRDKRRAHVLGCWEKKEPAVRYVAISTLLVQRYWPLLAKYFLDLLHNCRLIHL